MTVDVLASIHPNVPKVVVVLLPSNFISLLKYGHEVPFKLLQKLVWRLCSFLIECQPSSFNIALTFSVLLYLLFKNLAALSYAAPFLLYCLQDCVFITVIILR